MITSVRTASVPIEEAWISSGQIPVAQSAYNIIFMLVDEEFVGELTFVYRTASDNWIGGCWPESPVSELNLPKYHIVIGLNAIKGLRNRWILSEDIIKSRPKQLLLTRKKMAFISSPTENARILVNRKDYDYASPDKTSPGNTHRPPSRSVIEHRNIAYMT